MEEGRGYQGVLLKTRSRLLKLKGSDDPSARRKQVCDHPFADKLQRVSPRSTA
jgi:hypothetical protein